MKKIILMVVILLSALSADNNKGKGLVEAFEVINNRKSIAESSFCFEDENKEQALCSQKKIKKGSLEQYMDIAQKINRSFVYEAEKKGEDKWTLLSISNNVGDCEDWALTFLDKAIQKGLKASMVVGAIIGKRGLSAHAFIIVRDKEGKLWMFDNNIQGAEVTGQGGYSDVPPIDIISWKGYKDMKRVSSSYLVQGIVTFKKPKKEVKKSKKSKKAK